MKKLFLALTSAVLMAASFACSSSDQEKAKVEIKDDAQKTTAEAKKAGAEIKQDAKDLSRKVDAAVKPDSENASDKMSAAGDRVKDASSKAGVKLDQAALLAKVKTKLASDAGLATLTKVEVTTDGSVVMLSGEVSSAEQKKAVEKAAAQVDGVTKVVNNVVVAQ